MTRPKSLPAILASALISLAALLPFHVAPVRALDMTGTIANSCFDDGTCAEGACNRRNRCEPCGGHGQIACQRDIICYEWYRGFRPIPTTNSAYCGLTSEEYAYAPGYCGFRGFPPCPGSPSCQGASVFDSSANLCVACGLLEQSCCLGSPDRLCDEGLCNPGSGRCEPKPPPATSTSGPSGAPPSGGFTGSGGLFGDPPSASDPAPAPAPEIAGAICMSRDGRHDLCRQHNCNIPTVTQKTCWSSDGRHGMCRGNGCQPQPPCYWEDTVVQQGVPCYWESGASQNSRVCKSRDGRHELCRQRGCSIPTLTEQVCWSRDGRHGMCRDNGCQPQSLCYWEETVVQQGVPCYWE